VAPYNKPCSGPLYDIARDTIAPPLNGTLGICGIVCSRRVAQRER
jgi:hypothetical protein